MEIIFQFPIIDLRAALQPGAQLNVWPTPDMSREEVAALMATKPFVRSFGKITGSGEGYYCPINCIRYAELQLNGFSIAAGERTSVIATHRRLYADGHYTKKAELGFKDDLEDRLTGLQTFGLTDVLKHFAGLPLDVLSGDKDAGTGQPVKATHAIRLQEAGEWLAANYCSATTHHGRADGSNDYVVCGEPCIVLVYNANENLLRPSYAQQLDEYLIDGSTIKLYGYKWNNEDGRIFKVWLFELPGGLVQSPDIVRELAAKRANLFRLNAEKETTRILVNSQPEALPDPASVKYIKRTAEKVFRKERFTTAQESVRGFALQSGEENGRLATVADLERLFDRYAKENLQAMEQHMQARPPQKTILFITSNPTDSTPINFGEQLKAIDDALQAATNRAYFKILTPKTGLEKERLMEVLYTLKPDYLHITLHASKINGLYFQDRNRKPDPLPADEFAEYIRMLNQLKSPEVIILSACNSLGHAEAVREYCRYVMGTNCAFPDLASIVYAEKFYTALFNGNEENVRFCHDIAILGIKRHNNPPFDPVDEKAVHDIPQLIYKQSA